MVKVKNKILELRADGLSYRQIQAILGCSKGTIAYHCNPNEKQNAKERRLKNRIKITESRKKAVAFIVSSLLSR